MSQQNKRTAKTASIVTAILALVLIIGIFVAWRLNTMNERNAAINSERLLQLVNSERSSRNTQALVLSSAISTSAQQKAEDMKINGYYGHKDKNGVAGYEYIEQNLPEQCSRISENLIIVKQNADPYMAISGWLNSKDHRDAMLDPKYTQTGFGVAQAPNNELYVVEHFCELK